MMIGASQLRFLQDNRLGLWFETATHSNYRSCLKLHDRGLLDRDQVNPNKFRINSAGLAHLEKTGR